MYLLQKYPVRFWLAVVALVAGAAVMLLSGCGDSTPPGYVAPQQQARVIEPAASGVPTQVVVQQAPPQEQSSWMPALIGGAVGYMLGSSNRQTVPQAPAPAPRVIERRIYTQAPAPTPPVALAPKPATPAPTIPSTKSIVPSSPTPSATIPKFNQGAYNYTTPKPSVTYSPSFSSATTRSPSFSTPSRPSFSSGRR